MSAPHEARRDVPTLTERSTAVSVQFLTFSSLQIRTSTKGRVRGCSSQRQSPEARNSKPERPNK